MNEHQIRQNEIKNLAAGPEGWPLVIPYTEAENEVWATVYRTLMPHWQHGVAQQILEASQDLNLPEHRIPQLSEVSHALLNLSGFEFRAVPGLVDVDTFFGGLAKNIFLSTQYIREAKNPFYTEEPDVIHEVLGHGTLLADSDLAQLHRLAGSALVKVETEAAKQFIANVWWFSGEFGVVFDRTQVKAYGAGILSSVTELKHLANAAIEPLNISTMGQATYRIDQLQTRLFAAQSMSQVLDVIGGFFSDVDDEQIFRYTN